jgi:hypothetical protein
MKVDLQPLLCFQSRILNDLMIQIMGLLRSLSSGIRNFRFWSLSCFKGNHRLSLLSLHYWPRRWPHCKIVMRFLSIKCATVNYKGMPLTEGSKCTILLILLFPPFYSFTTFPFQNMSDKAQEHNKRLVVVVRLGFNILQLLFRAGWLLPLVRKRYGQSINLTIALFVVGSNIGRISYFVHYLFLRINALEPSNLSYMLFLGVPASQVSELYYQVN